MPAGAVEQRDGVRAARDAPGDFVQMRLHRLGVGAGHGERGADAARRTNGAEQIGVLIRLAGGLARSR